MRFAHAKAGLRGPTYMKTVLYFFGALLTIHSASLADTLDRSAIAVVSSAQPIASVQLVDQKFEPIYEEQPYQATCSREVLDHVEAVCVTSNDQVCSGGGRVCRQVRDQVCNDRGCTPIHREVCEDQPRSCTNVPRRSCSDHPVYRTDYYSCTRYRTVVVGQRLVKTFQHQVEVVLDNPAAAGAQALQLQVSANQGQIGVQLISSFADHLLHQQIQDLGQTDSGDVVQIRKRIVITHGISGAIARQILSSSIADLKLGFEAAKFRIVNGAALAPHLKLAIRIKRNRRIGGDSTLYDGTQLSSQLGFVGQGADLQALIPLQRLGIEGLSSKRHDIELSISLNVANVLNTADFGAAAGKVLEANLKGINPEDL
jgi:hypothetical protein